ncbi:malonyl-ACP O-methyltransferase BioC [Zhongshania sp.]|uniref:malonyl-ACP O-methyltransferase BioC n=1 Tax=Zhongshania sp. TaxID=1971902 RepID=UPI00356251B1
MAIYREHLAAYRKDAAELVLLHGWASDSSIWRPLLAALRRNFHITLIDLPGCGRSARVMASSDPDHYIDAILPLVPAKAIYCGWSLGGMLATRLAARFPDRVQALICVASNAVFVADADWPAAMAKQNFDVFSALVAANPRAGLRRFELLQLHGDCHAKEVRAELQGLAIAPSQENLSPGLACLQSLDNRQALADLACPCLYLFGGEDALVPSAAAAIFAERYPQHSSQQLAGRGHILFLADVGELSYLLLSYCHNWGLVAKDKLGQLNKSDIGRSFSRAAHSYDGAALLQRRVADRLIAYLPQEIAGPILDLGCGTGYSLPALQARIGVGPLVALDLAAGMVSHAAEQYSDIANYFVCGDAEDLPLADSSVATIFSSLALQWCENLAGLMFEIERVLQPGGSAVIATLGPNTLHELRSAWSRVDGFVHVNQFAERDDLAAAISGSSLAIEAWDEVVEVMYYDRLSELTRELKSIGAHNVNGGRPSGLTGRQRLEALTQQYEVYRGAELKLPASYQLWYLQLSKCR